MDESMSKTFVKFWATEKVGLAIASAVVVAMTIIASVIMFQATFEEGQLNRKYTLARYQVSTPDELRQKYNRIGTLSPKALARLKNLDMPDVSKVEASVASLDLFDHTFSRQELCVAQAVYFEARSEPLIGQVAIAEVILNRVHSRRYPNTACKVVFQNEKLFNRCQFSFACDGKKDRPTNIRSWEQALKVVALVMSGERSGVAKQATHYHADYVSPNWRLHLAKVGEVGRHIFYTDI